MDENETASLPTQKIDSSVPPFASAPPKIAGMDLEILIKFLILFRDHYKKCEKATFFLENRTHIANVPGIANQRDAISHFSTALQLGSTPEQQLEQYVNAVEHFRRAIFEPYEIAIKQRTFDLIDLYHRYKSTVAPVLGRHEALTNAPSIESVDAKIRQIADWRDSARSAKGENVWNDKWEKGVGDCIDAFDAADVLYRDLDKYCNIYEQILRDETRDDEIRKLRAENERLKESLQAKAMKPEDLS